MKVYREHIINDVPNNWATRWAVRWVVRRMTRAESKWTLQLRWRSPRKGWKRVGNGELVPAGVDWPKPDDYRAWRKRYPQRAGARRFSVYVRERAGSSNARRARAEVGRRTREEWVAHERARVAAYNERLPTVTRFN